jgi:hypothetical protein
MGKIDDIRKQREQRFSERQRVANPLASNGRAKSPGEPVQPEIDGPDATKGERVPPRKKSSFAPRAVAEVKGKCPVCGKIRAVSNGLIAYHQKGLGKACGGSRQKPA